MQGMMGFGEPLHYPEMDALTVADADDIHAFVIAQSWEAYNAQKRSQGSP